MVGEVSSLAFQMSLILTESFFREILQFWPNFATDLTTDPKFDRILDPDIFWRPRLVMSRNSRNAVEMVFWAQF